jgi:hypothetical protein
MTYVANISSGDFVLSFWRKTKRERVASTSRTFELINTIDALLVPRFDGPNLQYTLKKHGTPSSQILNFLREDTEMSVYLPSSGGKDPIWGPQTSKMKCVDTPLCSLFWTCGTVYKLSNTRWLTLTSLSLKLL